MHRRLPSSSNWPNSIYRLRNLLQNSPMSAELLDLETRALRELKACADEAALRTWNTRFFGDNGEVKKALAGVGKVPKDQRPAYGKQVNEIKVKLEAEYQTELSAAKERALERSLTEDVVDVSLPGRPVERGRLHLATQTLREIQAVFADMGFQVYRSRDVEDDETNFELLNMPPHHPARDMWDTFHTTTPGVLLRTHTSPGQIHVMREFGGNGTK